MAGRAAVLAGLLVAAAVLLALGGPSQGAVTEGDADRTLSAVAVGRQVFARMGCGGCHRLAAGGGEGRIGPALDERLPGYHAARLRARIVDLTPPASRRTSRGCRTTTAGG